MSLSRRMLVAFLLNLSFAIIEAFFGLTFRSSAVLADALHDAGDVLVIGGAVFLEGYAQKSSDETFTLGYKRFSLLGALLTALVLITGSITVMVNSFPKLWVPETVNHQGMLGLGVVAIMINIIASRFVTGHQHGHNATMLSLHFLEDTLGWLAVILVALLIPLTQWYFLDPLLSLLIAGVMLFKTLPSLWSTLKLLLNAKPDGLDVPSLSRELSSQNHVFALDKLFFFSMSHEEHWALVSLEIDHMSAAETIKEQTRQVLSQYGVQHSIIELSLVKTK